LLKKHSSYLLVFTLIFLIIFSNLINNDRAGAMEIKVPQTVMSNLIKTDFSALQNEELIEETSSQNNILVAGQDKYIDDSCALEKDIPTSQEEEYNSYDLIIFDDSSDLVFKPQLLPGENGSDSSGEMANTRTEIIYYTVQNGDTVSTIARHFGITVNTILWANNLTSFSLIRPGDRLSILPYSGVLYTVKKGDTLAKIAQTYDVELEKILSCNTLGNSLSIGQKIVVPGAKKIASTVTSRPTNTGQSGISVIKNLIKNPTVKTSGNKMAWPTSGNRITQYFSWRHTGLDIANKVGTPIYAADSGTVIIAQGGWNGGYGNTIVIDHGGGKKTRYGHASKLFVKVGDEVEKGENIAAMGSTGRSTGSHLHFEVLIGGVKYNPLNYIR